jgi:hypothetical protein
MDTFQHQLDFGRNRPGNTDIWNQGTAYIPWCGWTSQLQELQLNNHEQEECRLPGVFDASSASSNRLV